MAAFVDFDAVKQRVSYPKVLSFLQIVGKAEGPNKLRCACPFCKDPRSFVVTLDAGKDGKGLSGCFRCGKRGLDSIGLVAALKGLKNNEAAQELENHFGLDTSTVPMTRNSTEPGNSTLPSQSHRGQGGKSAFDPEAYASRLDSTHPSLVPLGLLPETLAYFKAGYAKGGSNQGRLALRVDTLKGEFAAFIGRSLSDEDSPLIKAPNGFDLEAHIFNGHRVAPGELYIAQDPLKVLIAHEAGQENVVSFLTEGSSALQWQMLAALMDERQCSHCYIL